MIPMHYRTQAIDFPEPPDALLGAEVQRPDSSESEVEPQLGTTEQPRVVLLAARLR